MPRIESNGPAAQRPLCRKLARLDECCPTLLYLRIERVSYRAGFVQRPGEATRLPAITIDASDLP